MTTRSIANLGAYEVEVIIEPVRPLYGGGGFVPGAPLDKYKIKIRITKDGKSWRYEQTVSNRSARVLARLLRVKMPEEPTITVYSATAASSPPIDIKVTNT